MKIMVMGEQQIVPIILRLMATRVGLVLGARDSSYTTADHPSERLVPCEWTLRFRSGAALAISSFRPNAFFTPG